jgi:4-hydroxyphenylacetate 3-monooxygenase
MRTGSDYKTSLRDGRRVWVMNDGLVEDVVTHPATSAMIEEYVTWYDRHFDPAWRETLVTEAGTPVWAVLPRSAADLRRLGASYSATTFINAGNITHTPAYGHLIALGVETAVRAYGKFPAQIENAAAYRQLIADSGRFLTFASGQATIGYRMRPDPAERNALRIVKETPEGLFLSGKIGMFTSPAYAEDVYIGANSACEYNGHRVTCIVPINAPGVTVLCRKISVRDANPFMSSLSARNDELDGQMWLDNVFVPNDRLFFLDANVDPIARWLFWHQLYCWLAKGEFALGLGLALTDAMGLVQGGPTIEMLVSMITDVQTVRTCITAAELDPSFTPEGYCYPNHCHIAVGSIAMLNARQRLTETLRILPGSSMIVAPSDSDLRSAEVGAGLEESFGGGGYSAEQRAALLQMAWDHVGSSLDGREGVYELHSNGGIPVWRGRLRRSFTRYNELANAVLKEIRIDMPAVDLSSIPAAPMTPRRVVAAAPTGG